MAHSYYAVYEHITFSTKSRIPCLDETLQPILFAYLAQAATNQGCRCVKAGGYREHVHLLVLKSRTLLTADLVKEIKRISSGWVKRQKPALRGFAWQEGYGAFSVIYSQLGRVRTYIEGQAEHHRKITWEEEFRGLLKRHGIEFDERFVFD